MFGEKDADMVCLILYHYLENFLDENVRYIRAYPDAETYFKTKFLI